MGYSYCDKPVVCGTPVVGNRTGTPGLVLATEAGLAAELGPHAKGSRPAPRGLPTLAAAETGGKGRNCR